MNIKKYHFNNEGSSYNDYLIKSQINPIIPENNSLYISKNYYQKSMPNHTLNFHKNIITDEQSTLLTSEDYQIKANSLIKQRERNNCQCMCHHIEDSIKKNCHNVHIIHCHSPNMNNHNQYFHQCENNPRYTKIYKSVHNSLNRRQRNNNNRNFELIYDYEKLKKEYSLNRPNYYYKAKERLKNLDYMTENKDKLCYHKNLNFWNKIPNYKHLNRSCDDRKINNSRYYNHNFLLQKTKTILGFPPYNYGFLTSNNSSFNIRRNPINNLVNENNGRKIYSNLNDNKKIEEPKNKGKNKNNDKNKNESNDYNNFTFKEIKVNNEDENNKNKIENDNLIQEKINPEIEKNNKNDNDNNRDNNNKLSKDNFNTKINQHQQINNSNKKNKNYNRNKKNNIQINNDLKPNNNNYNNDSEEKNNNNIYFEIKQTNDDYNTQNNKNSKMLGENNNNNLIPIKIESNKSNNKNNNIKDDNNIDINKDLKEILKERNLFLKIKKKKKGKTGKNKDKENNINNNKDPNEKLIRDILNLKIDGQKKYNNNKKKCNSRYLDNQNNNIDSIIEKILQKNHGKKSEIPYNRNYNNKENISYTSKIKYPNTKTDKKFGISKNNDYKSFKDLKKQSNNDKIKKHNTNNLNKKGNIKNNKISSKSPGTKDINQLLSKIKNDKDKDKNKNNLNKKIKNNQINNKPNTKNEKINKGNLSSNIVEKKDINKSKSVNNIKKNNKKIEQNNQFPYLDIFKLNKINKVIRDGRYKNSILYSNIIKPYNNTKTLLNNNKISYKQPKIIEHVENLNIKTTDDNNNKNNIIKEKEEIFNLTVPNKNNNLKTSKSCIINNRYNLGNVNHLFRNQSANFGNCFACNFGCSVSRSGYSPMNYSPYDGRKREDNLGLPSYILYQYSKNL